MVGKDENGTSMFGASSRLNPPNSANDTCEAINNGSTASPGGMGCDNQRICLSTLCSLAPDTPLNGEDRCQDDSLQKFLLLHIANIHKLT